MKRKKSSEDNIPITHNNIMLDMDSSLINYFRAMAIEKLEQNKKELGFYEKKEKKAVIKAMDDMRARVIVNAIKNFLSKIISKKFRKKEEREK